MPLPTLRLPPHGSQRTARGETWFGYSFVSGDLHPLPSASSPGAPDPRRCPRGGTRRRCSPRRAAPTPRSGSSPQPYTACVSCAEYPEPFSPPGRSCSLISVSSSFPSVTTMSQKSSVMQLPQFVPKALTSDNNGPCPCPLIPQPRRKGRRLSRPLSDYAPARDHDQPLVQRLAQPPRYFRKPSSQCVPR